MVEREATAGQLVDDPPPAGIHLFQEYYLKEAAH
jgi:hypothetical protein